MEQGNPASFCSLDSALTKAKVNLESELKTQIKDSPTLLKRRIYQIIF